MQCTALIDSGMLLCRRPCACHLKLRPHSKYSDTLYFAGPDLDQLYPAALAELSTHYQSGKLSRHISALNCIAIVLQNSLTQPEIGCSTMEGVMAALQNWGGLGERASMSSPLARKPSNAFGNVLGDHLVTRRVL